MLNVPTAEQAPGVTASMRSRWARIHRSTKDTTIYSIKSNAKLKKKKSLASGYLSHSTFSTPPPFSTCLHPPHAMNRSPMNLMQIACAQQCTPSSGKILGLKSTSWDVSCQAFVCASKGAFSFLKDAKIAGVHSLGCVSLQQHCSLGCFCLNAD